MGPSVIAILAGMGGGLLFRELLIRTIRTHHPETFTELGEPSSRKLSTIIPRYQDMQIRFWKFIWGGQAFRLRDQIVSILSVAILVSNIVLAAGVVGLLWAVASKS